SGEKFIAKGKVVINAGWKEVYENRLDDEELTDDIKDQLLPNIEKGDVLKTRLVSRISGQTKPPARLTEATLVSAIERSTKYTQTSNKELAHTLRSTGRLCTLATRADIIDKLFYSFLVRKRGDKEI